MPHHFPTLKCLNLKPNQGTQEAPSARQLYLQACTTVFHRKKYTVHSTQYAVRSTLYTVHSPFSRSTCILNKGHTLHVHDLTVTCTATYVPLKLWCIFHFSFFISNNRHYCMAVVLKEIYHWRLPSMYMVCMQNLVCTVLYSSTWVWCHKNYISGSTCTVFVDFYQLFKKPLKKLIFVHMYKFITSKY